ncbi:MAG: GAF and ANTAR domain-containing protein [Actinobacteria bacterium]|nr:GAF and ANTAR domain-containing protein [Actinomycetota bacterium]
MNEEAAIQRIAESFTSLGRDLVDGPDLDQTLGIVSRRALEMIAGAEQASITRGRGGRFETVGATGPMATNADAIQYDVGTGPCVDAAVQDAVFRTGDLAADPRWPEFGKRAAGAEGVASMLSARLYFEDDDLIAALNLYSRQYDAFDDVDVSVVTILSVHASSAITSVRLRDRVENLMRALKSNRDIGAAVGVLMAQYKLTQDQAFDLLRVASQHRHRKLADIAHEVIETGAIELPALD